MISETYTGFFERTFNERHVMLQGGRRSGKTFATFQYLQAKNEAFGGCRKVLVVCNEFQPLQRTMEDFTDCLGGVPVMSGKDGYSCNLHGVKWQFSHFKDNLTAQGTKCDDMFVNEAVNVKWEIINALIVGVRDQVFYNFNPTRSTQIRKLMNGKNCIVTTFRDNSFLTQEQVDEFEKLKERAQAAGAKKRDIYLYKVYYLGEFSDMAGSVFGQIYRCSDEQYRQIPAMEIFGLDFGFATDGDPTTLVGVKVHERKIYIKEYIYERGLTSDIELGEKMLGIGINYRTLIVGDYGGMGRGRMNTLISADNGKWEGELHKGFSIVDAPKGKTIMDGLGQMLAMDGIYVTDSSIHAIEEFESYEMNEKGKFDGEDHTIDAARYAAVWAMNRL